MKVDKTENLINGSKGKFASEENNPAGRQVSMNFMAFSLKKKASLVVFSLAVLLFVIAGIPDAYSSTGCCLVEPNQCKSGVTLNACCGQPDENDPFFQECRSNYFVEGESCQAVSMCDSGCCCKDGALNSYFYGSRIACDGVNGTLKSSGDCKKICQDPTSPPVGQCNLAQNPLSSLDFRRDFSGSPAKIIIIWNDKCLNNVRYYEVFRGSQSIGQTFGNSIEDFGRTKIDSGPGFLFGESYTYTVKAYYSDAEGNLYQHQIQRMNIYSGDLECWLNPSVGKSDFCVSHLFYETYMSYFGYSDKPQFQQFLINDPDLLNKFKKGFRCSYDYLLYEKVSCTDEKPCTVRGQDALCSASSDCINYNQEVGLVVSRNECNQNVGCFYEYGVGLSGLCLDCVDTVKSCYNYRSEDACRADNCNVAYDENCDWISINDDLGIGICIDASIFSCSDCFSDFEGDPYASCSIIYDHPGFSHCVFCTAVEKCTDYIDQNSCIGDSPVYLDPETHRIQKSKDLCGLGVCNYFYRSDLGMHLCQKNIDLDPSRPDCPGHDGDPCEIDIFPPEIKLGLIGSDPNSFRVDDIIEFMVIDRQSANDMPHLVRSTAYDHYLPDEYSIYVCIEGKNCHTNPGNWKKTGQLRFSGCDLIDLVGFNFEGGSQTLRFFAQDPAGNLAEIKSETLTPDNEHFCSEIETELCELQDGVCEGSSQNCNLICSGYGFFKDECTLEDYQRHSDYYSQTEILGDGLDNNCDGQIDHHPKECYIGIDGKIIDRDGDGICKPIDQCPETPLGCDVWGYDGASPGCAINCDQAECYDATECIECTADLDCPTGDFFCGEDNFCIKKYQFCNEHRPCSQGYVCLNNACAREESHCFYRAECNLQNYHYCFDERCTLPQCSGEFPCPPGYGYECVDNFCKSEALACVADTDCDEGYVCVNGFCMLEEDVDLCTKDLDCDEGYLCIGGACVKAVDFCESDDDCGFGQQCINGVCVDDDFDLCTEDADCDEGHFCFYGMCLKIPEPCKDNSDCQEGFFCFEGACKYDGHPPECERDSSGKIIDLDGDGICDYLDDCLGTPQWCTVQGYDDLNPGCAAYCDDVLCKEDLICKRNPADHPEGCEVDTQGWVIDSDGDGVCDEYDLCFGTREGCKVYGYDGKRPGCPVDCSYPECLADPSCKACINDSDCPKGFICSAGKCVIAPGTECTEDADCDEGYFCDEGLCLKIISTCEEDDDCDEGYFCLNGFCKLHEGHPEECQRDNLGKIVDKDKDGICDMLDECLNTPEGCEVQGYDDENPGCAADCGDSLCRNDLICKIQDKCERDVFGNIIDSDGDGICDGVDVCEGTLPGCPVFPFSHELAGCPEDCNHQKCFGDPYCDCFSCDDCTNVFSFCDRFACSYCDFGRCAMGDFEGPDSCYDCSWFSSCADYINEQDCKRNPCIKASSCKWQDGLCVADKEDKPVSLDHCFNFRLDGDETDIDCGGSCAPCASGKMCLVNSDCQSGFCSENGICEGTASCSDGIKNQDETDIDCGGSVCLPCENGLACLVNLDCKSGFCKDGMCVSPSCFDKVKNQGESDVDCGGPNCLPCPVGKRCTKDSDCVSGKCDPILGVCVESDEGSSEIPVIPKVDDEIEKRGFPWLLLIIFLIVFGAAGFLIYYFREPIVAYIETSRLAPAYYRIRDFFERLVAKLGIKVKRPEKAKNYYKPGSKGLESSPGTSFENPSSPQASQKPASGQKFQQEKPRKKKTLDKKIKNESKIFDIFDEPKKK